MQKALCLIILALLSTDLHASLELIQEPSTHFRTNPLIFPTIQEKLADGNSLIPKSLAWAFGVGAEIPVLQWFNSGFLLMLNTGLPDFTPVIDLSFISKFQWPIAVLETGNFALYAMLPLGITYTTHPVVDEVARRAPANSDEKLFDNGVGVNGAALAGFEFFPIRYVGFFVDAGYKGSVLFHQIVKGKDEERTWRYSSYWIHGATVSFGLKVAL